MTGRLAVKNGKYYVVISYKDDHGKHKQKWTATGLDAKNNKRAAEEAMREIVANFGLRRSELCGMKWESIDFDKNTLTHHFKTFLEHKRAARKKDMQMRKAGISICPPPKLAEAEGLRSLALPW